MNDLPLTAAQEAEAQRLYEHPHQAFDSGARRLARLMASKPDAQLLGATEFAVRDCLLHPGAQVVQAALQERKNGGIAPPAPTAPAAGKGPAASAGGSAASSR